MKLTTETIKHLIPVFLIKAQSNAFLTEELHLRFKKIILSPKNWKLRKKNLAKTEFKHPPRKEQIREFLRFSDVGFQGIFYENEFDKIENYDRCVYRIFEIEDEFSTCECFFEVITTPKDDKIICWVFS